VESSGRYRLAGNAPPKCLGRFLSHGMLKCAYFLFIAACESSNVKVIKRLETWPGPCKAG
jgi:hypothetical protein